MTDFNSPVPPEETEAQPEAGIQGVPATADPQTGAQMGWKSFFMEIFQTVLLALILYFLIDAVVARVRVENISMEPTLQPGEFLLVNKLAYRFGEIHRADIVVFHYPQNPNEDYIKRVVGVPGDQVEVRGGEVWVNGQMLEEKYIQDSPAYSGMWTVPADNIFVLGDNRNQSSDSHSWGFVPRHNVVGRAIFIYWPIQEMRVLNEPLVVKASNGQ